MSSRCGFLLAWCWAGLSVAWAAEEIRVDAEGVLRWTADETEVALFGANYSLPSSSDFRAAGYVHADRHRLIEKDFAHFARLGWDGVRLDLWGDWENCDQAGNLLINEHLDLLDHAIAEAGRRGLHVLLTPITTYSAWWPDGKPTDAYPGFSKIYDRSILGTNPAAIAAQCNYLRQLLNHVNAYTHRALKDEPAIALIEMINEPVHHPEDFAGSVAYINALVDAVRSTGCAKPLFHNLTQDLRIAPAIRASRVQGMTFAWYPTGLNAGRMLTGSHLRAVDEFTPLLAPDLRAVPKLVYEFDSPDLNTAYLYPAMARAFRGVGAQFAAMFSYDMLDTAAYNLGWQTHFLNLVYSPKKAVSALIAAEVMRRVPRYARYGGYPDNRRFGPFAVSDTDDSSEMLTEDTFLYANGSGAVPTAPALLRRIAGTGRSLIVDYEGSGAYFLDRLGDGLWRLELYPDAVLVQDPFAQYLNFRTVSSRLLWHDWPLTLRLPGLGDTYTVTPLNEGNTRKAVAQDGTFLVSPGVYLLSRDTPPAPAQLPAMVGRVGLREFVCPPPPVLPVQVLPAVPPAFIAGEPARFAAEVVAAQLPRAVTLQVRAPGAAAFQAHPMVRSSGYTYRVELPEKETSGPALEYFIAVETAAGVVRQPATGLWRVALAGPGAPIALFTAGADESRLMFSRIGDGYRQGVFKKIPANGREPAALRLLFPLSLDRTLADYTAALEVKDRLDTARLPADPVVRLRARGSGGKQPVWLTLVEADGTAWSARLVPSLGWSEQRIPLADFHPARGVLLPLGYPGQWNYWVGPARGRGGPGDRPRSARVEQVQFSFRPDPAAPAQAGAPDAWVDLAALLLAPE